MFTPRTVRPEAGNKYYIRRASGGYSTAITGKPTDKDCDVLANCVGYAVGRFHEIAQRPAFDLLDAVNAENLIANAKQHGLRTGAVPAEGALIVWAKGKAGDSSDGAGHVAVVEQITEDGHILTSESGYGAKQPFWTQRRNAQDENWGQSSAYIFIGFVYQPEPVPAGVIRKGEQSAAVLWLQTQLAAAGYLRRKEVDGDFGKITLGALLAYQLEHGLKPDGICGPATKAALTAGR